MSDLHVRVTGVVQGVGFRWFVRERARRLRLSGWVRNLADGTVEVRASGADEDIERLKAELLRGPSGASVEQLVPVAADASEPPQEPFAILR